MLCLLDAFFPVVPGETAIITAGVAADGDEPWQGLPLAVGFGVALGGVVGRRRRLR